MEEWNGCYRLLSPASQPATQQAGSEAGWAAGWKLSRGFVLLINKKLSRGSRPLPATVHIGRGTSSQRWRPRTAGGLPSGCPPALRMVSLRRAVRWLWVYYALYTIYDVQYRIYDDILHIVHYVLCSSIDCTLSCVQHHRERERAPVVDVNECLGASFLISKLLSK